MLIQDEYGMSPYTLDAWIDRKCKLKVCEMPRWILKVKKKKKNVLQVNQYKLHWFLLLKRHHVSDPKHVDLLPYSVITPAGL